MQKKQYSEPTLTVHGTVEELTLSASSGSRFDKTYPVGTPAPTIITFS